MEVKEGFLQKERYKDIILTIGFYDGIHKGHQRILEEMVNQAKKRRGKTCVITFASYFDQSFFGEPLSLLTVREEKKEILAQIGIDLVIILAFTPQLASLSPYSFMKRLDQNLEIKEIIVGEDFVFGKGREGNVDWLKEKEEIFGYKLKVIPLLKIGKEKLSSSLIRGWLRKGEIEKVTQWLGRYPTVLGKVVKGKRRGRNLGYPTANLEPYLHKLLPGVGVYAGRISLKGKTYRGIINVGSRPTFGDTSFGVEVHILRFKGDIYEEPIKIELAARLREIEEFPSHLYLTKKLEEDSKRVERIKL